MALAALGHLANFAQIGDIYQGHAHQREAVRWTRRNFSVDVLALKIDLLGAARDDVRGTYDTYIERLNTMLLLNALVLPFGLNTLQFSDPFVPGIIEDCVTCIDRVYPFLLTIWVYMVAATLILPFWAILLLLKCKWELDTWLQRALDELQVTRRDIIRQSTLVISQSAVELAVKTQTPLTEKANRQREEKIAEEQQLMVARLSTFIVEFQDNFGLLWREKCASYVRYATILLWLSLYAAVCLVGYMFWIFLANHETTTARGNEYHFAVLLSAGLLVPVIPIIAFVLRSSGAPVTSGISESFIRNVASLNGDVRNCQPSASVMSGGSDSPSPRTSLTGGCRLSSVSQNFPSFLPRSFPEEPLGRT